jgi:hypothetical protein
MSEAIKYLPESLTQPEKPKYRPNLEKIYGFLPDFNTTEMTLLADMLTPRVK